MRSLTLLALTVCSVFAGQVSMPSGSGFANACGGYTVFSRLPNPGDGFLTASDETRNCSTQTAASSSVSAAFSGVYNGIAFENSASAKAAPGTIKTQTANNAGWNVHFPGAGAGLE